MKDWKLSGWNMKRFHKRRQVVVTHNIKALSLSDQSLRLALPVFCFSCRPPHTRTHTPWRHITDVNRPLCPEVWAGGDGRHFQRCCRRAECDRLYADLHCHCLVLRSAVNTSLPRCADCNKEETFYLPLFPTC